MNNKILLIFSIVSILVLSAIYAYGQNYDFDPAGTLCYLHRDQHLIILDLTCGEKIDAIIWATNQGYQIKAIQGYVVMFLQK